MADKPLYLRRVSKGLIFEGIGPKERKNKQRAYNQARTLLDSHDRAHGVIKMWFDAEVCFVIPIAVAFDALYQVEQSGLDRLPRLERQQGDRQNILYLGFVLNRVEDFGFGPGKEKLFDQEKP